MSVEEKLKEYEGLLGKSDEKTITITSNTDVNVGDILNTTDGTSTQTFTVTDLTSGDTINLKSYDWIKVTE